MNIKEEIINIIPKNTVLCCLTGSHAYGTARPDSDYDIIGCCIGDINTYLGLKNFEQFQFKNEKFDIVIYEIKKFFRLIITQNPTILSSLCLDDEFYIILDDVGKKIIKNKNMFLSKKLYNSFVGYAYGQLKRMTNGDEKKYTGNRKESYEKYGYDCKNAMSLIRLLRLGIEFLTTGKLLPCVKGDNVRELIDILEGKYSLEKIETLSSNLFKQANTLYNMESSIPKNIDENKVNSFLVDILKRHFNLYNNMSPQELMVYKNYMFNSDNCNDYYDEHQ